MTFIRGEYPDKVTILGVPCDVVVKYKASFDWGSTPYANIEAVIGPLGTDIKSSLGSVVCMADAECRIVGGKVYWYGYSQLNLLYDSLWYRIKSGRIA